MRMSEHPCGEKASGAAYVRILTFLLNLEIA
jgi:hypothetical protein